jgi:FkbM family methyltransferase
MTASRAPFLFRVARSRIRRGARGGHKLLALTRRLGMLDRVVRHPIDDRVSLDVPIGRPENAWDRADVLDYQAEMVDDLAEAIHAMEPPVTIVDCGADIGLVSVLLSARCRDRLGSVIAIEPNEAVAGVLERNMARLDPPGRVVRAAASHSSGRGSLASPDYDRSDHARYLVAAREGDVRVVRIDDLGLPPGASLAIKLDVEGAELDALRGAEQSLAAAGAFAVAFEAHPAVTERTGVDPVEIARFLVAIRPCEVTVSEFPALEIDLERPLLSQFDVPSDIGFNVMCRTR